MKHRRICGATKARTGCESCKQKHVKCDEAKPECARCRQVGRRCVYNPIRMFTVQTQHTSARQNEAIPSMPSPLQAVSCTALAIEERRAMYVWVTLTGPWIANYGSPKARSFWTATLPRCASSLPALRHILVAIALLDDCAPRPNFSTVRKQYRQILQHYNAAIALLTRATDVKPLEFALTAVLSWLLEIMGFNIAVANIHLSAARKLIDEHNTRFEQDDILVDDMPTVLEFCEGYSASIIHPQSSKPPLPAFHDQDNPFLKALQLRRGPCPVSTCEEIRSAIHHYFVFVRPQIPREITIKEAEHFITYWKVAIVRFRYVATITQPVILLCYLAMSLAHTLLSVADETTQPASANLSDALGYILSRAEEIAALGLPRYDTQIRDSLLNLIATTVIEIPTDQGHHQLSYRLLFGCAERKPCCDP